MRRGALVFGFAEKRVCLREAYTYFVLLVPDSYTSVCLFVCLTVVCFSISCLGVRCGITDCESCSQTLLFINPVSAQASKPICLSTWNLFDAICLKSTGLLLLSF